MKTLILAGGYGNRLSELTAITPKPLVEINGKPLLIHIMEYYAAQGFNDFVIACGYKGEKIKEHFLNMPLQNSDFSIDMSSVSNVSATYTKLIKAKTLNWKVTFVDTGIDTLTGGRMKKCAQYLDGDEFMMTYGDGLSNINLKKLIDFHHAHKKKATISVVRMPRFGVVQVADNGKVESFQEKRLEHSPLINGGFMVLKKSVLDYIENESTAFETTPMCKLSEEGELFAFKHDGFWKCVDNLRDKKDLEEALEKGEGQWKA